MTAPHVGETPGLLVKLMAAVRNEFAVMCWSSMRRIRCSVAARVSSTAASVAPVGCVPATTSGGSTLAAQPSTTLSPRPITGGAHSGPTSAAGPAPTAPPGVGCVSCTLNDGNEPGAPTSISGATTRRQSRSQLRRHAAG